MSAAGFPATGSTRERPSALMSMPATTAQCKRDWGDMPDAIANAIASGKATKPTVTPASASDANGGQL